MKAPSPPSDALKRRIQGVALAVAVVMLLVVAGASASPTSSRPARSAAKSVVVSTRKVHGLGTILVSAKGRTLYMFVPDKRKKVSCTDGCAIAWPPLKLPKGAKAVATHAAKPKLLGSDSNPTGGRVVTYHGWPLYFWVGDKKPGQATGQALNVNGGLWYVLSPAGKIIKTNPATAQSASTTTQSSAPNTASTTVAAPPPTTVAATTTVPATSPATSASNSGCPAGLTVQQNDQNTGTAGDRDQDDGGGPDDSDGCL